MTESTSSLRVQLQLLFPHTILVSVPLLIVQYLCALIAATSYTGPDAVVSVDGAARVRSASGYSSIAE